MQATCRVQSFKYQWATESAVETLLVPGGYWRPLEPKSLIWDTVKKVSGYIDKIVMPKKLNPSFSSTSWVLTS